MSECKPPTEEELSLIRRWCANRSRLIRLGWILLAGFLVVAVVWGGASPTTRDLALGQGERVSAEVLGGDRAGSCRTGRYSAPEQSYRYAVKVIDPAGSTLAKGQISAVTLCGLERTGSQVEVTALPNGSLTARAAIDIWLFVSVGAALALVLGWILRRSRRQISSCLDLCDHPAGWQPSAATLQSKFGVRYADVSTPGGLIRLQLGRALSRPDGTLVRWRLQRVPYADPPGVTLLIPDAPESGTPVLVEDAAGARHWRTLTNVRG